MKKLLQTKISCSGLILLALVVLGGFYITASPAKPKAWFEGFERPIILAHQGGEKEWPSNTMVAFEKAREVGSDVLDSDLHMTKDKVLVLIHDTTVNRTTDGEGAVADMTWAELEGLDAAYNFSLDGKTYPWRGKGVRIPRLSDILEEFPDWKIQIEVKQAPLDTAQELAKVLKRHEAQDRVLLSCFDEEMMDELRRHCPDVASSATPREIRNFVIASRLHLESLITPDYACLQVPLTFDSYTLVDERTVQAAHSRSLFVLPWTIDRDEDVETCRQAGADGFNTNYPTRMEEVRANWLEPAEPLNKG